jgi:hypothetical protein
MAARIARRNLGEEIATFVKDTGGRGSWGHVGLASILKDVSVEEASWSPGGEAHSIWEELNHIIYWSQFSLDLLKAPVPSIKQAWPPTIGGAEGWKSAVARAARLHAALVKRIKQADQKVLAGKEPHPGSPLRGRFTVGQLLLGCGGHIAFHAGRIALLKKIYRTARPGVPAVRD